MENNKISELMQATMNKLKEMVDVNTVVGDPLETPDGITLVPVSQVSFGFVSGGGECGASKNIAGGNSAGAKIEPVGFLVVKNGSVRMMNITPPAVSTVDRVVEMMPQIIDRVDEFVDKHAAKKEDDYAY